MTRRYNPARQVERNAYRLARAAGDVAAAQRGPKPLARRLARRAVAGLIFRALHAR